MKTSYRTRIRGGNSTGTGYDFFSDGNTDWTNYNSRFCYIVKDEMQVVSIPVSKLGYNVGDTMTAFSLGYWYEDVKGTFVIDYIEYVKGTAGMITDFTKEGNALHARPDANVKWGTNDNGDYHYYDADGIAYDATENAVKIVDTQSRESSIRLYFARPVTVTVNTRISVNLKYIPVDSYANTDCIYLATNTGIIKALSSSDYGVDYKNGQYSTVTFSPYNALGVELDGELNYIDIVFTGRGELFVKNITTVELDV